MAHDITVGATRGRRMDEALTALRPLVAGSEVTMSGDFFTLDRGPHPSTACGTDRDRRVLSGAALRFRPRLLGGHPFARELEGRPPVFTGS